MITVRIIKKFCFHQQEQAEPPIILDMTGRQWINHLTWWISSSLWLYRLCSLTHLKSYNQPFNNSGYTNHPQACTDNREWRGRCYFSHHVTICDKTSYTAKCVRCASLTDSCCLQDGDAGAVNYAALDFSSRKVKRATKKKKKSSESPQECVYSAVRAEQHTRPRPHL